MLNREREGDLGVPSPWVDELDPEAMVAEAVVAVVLPVAGR